MICVRALTEFRVVVSDALQRQISSSFAFPIRRCGERNGLVEGKIVGRRKMKLQGVGSWGTTQQKSNENKQKINKNKNQETTARQKVKLVMTLFLIMSPSHKGVRRKSPDSSSPPAYYPCSRRL